MSTPSPEQERILQDIEALPEEAQLALAQAILQRIWRARAHGEQAAPSARVPSAALRGLLANGELAPSDDEVARWLDEARAEKYGG